MYRIREVDGHNEEVAEVLAELHRLTFLGSAPMPTFGHGYWWLALRGRDPVAFAGLIPSTRALNAGYFCRVGVRRRHWGRSLQLRFMRAAEKRARCHGWDCIISDTTENVVSANNFIKAGYELYQPRAPWAWTNTLYWRKFISARER